MLQLQARNAAQARRSLNAKNRLRKAAPEVDESKDMEVCKDPRPRFGSPYNKDHSISGSILGPFIFGSPNMDGCQNYGTFLGPYYNTAPSAAHSRSSKTPELRNEECSLNHDQNPCMTDFRSIPELRGFGRSGTAEPLDPRRVIGS